MGSTIATIAVLKQSKRQWLLFVVVIMSEEREIPGLWSASEPLEARENSQPDGGGEPGRQTRAQRRKALALRLGTHDEPEPPQPKPPSLGPKFWQSWRRWPTKWPFWVVVIVALPGGVALIAIASLFRLAAQPNCLSIFWPTASASDRLYCAEVTAQKQTVDDLLAAIDLVNALPKDHPLRTAINRQIENWSEDILKLGDAAFQAGNLGEAIAIARKVPSDVPAYPQVEKQIQQWQSIWDDAEKIYQAAEDYLRKEDWNQAFRQATLLLDIGNTYWETTRYEEITKAIQTSRADGNKLAKARSTAEAGGVDNLFAAIQLAGAIAPESYIYQAAQKAIAEFGKKIMELAEAQLKTGQWQSAIDIVNKIPESAKLKEEVKDFRELASAASQTQGGTIAGLENAIKAAKKIKSNRPLYNNAQEFISNWQQEIADVKTLEAARQVAAKGGANDLKAAIAQLQTIPAGNPRGPEAQKEIATWTRQVELMEDTPILERADQMATLGDANSLEAAIVEARKIGAGRALYQQAQDKIKTWGDQSQRFRDRPYLDQAQQLANDGNLLAAIAAASKIQPGRTLYDEARSNIRNWESQLQAKDGLQNARQAAEPGTADALETAILLANQVPESSGLRSEADEAINDWSQRIFAIAQEESASDLPGAIAILRKIPSGTRIYEEARSQIQVWQESLNSPPVESEPPIEKSNKQPKFPEQGLGARG